MKPFSRKLKKLYISTLIGVLFVCAFGTLLHFVYDWSNKHSIVGLIAPVNESVWEHMKMVYFPTLLFFLIEYLFLFKPYPYLLRADLAGILAGTLLIPILFYTYTGFLGENILLLDILTFIISSVFAFYVRYRSLLSSKRKRYTFVYFICVLILGVCFLIFTYYPPGIALFTPF